MSTNKLLIYYNNIVYEVECDLIYTTWTKYYKTKSSWIMFARCVNFFFKYLMLLEK